MYAAVILSIAAAFCAPKEERQHIWLCAVKAATHPLTLACLAFVALNGISILWSGEESAARYTKYGKQMLFIPLFALGYGLILLRNPKFYSIFISAFLVTATIAACAILVHHFLILDLPLTRRLEGFGRAKNSVMLGCLMGLAALLLLFPDHALREKCKKAYIRWLMLLPIVLCFLLPMSRGPILAVSIVLLLVLILAKHYKKAAAIAIGLAAAGAFVFSNEGLKSLLVKRASSGRIDIWQQGADLIAAKPFLGHGVATDHNYVFSYGERMIKATHVHNVYMAVLVQVGIVGLIALLAIYILAFREAYKSIKNESVYSPFIFLAMGASLGLTDFGGFYTSFGVPWLVFWLPATYLIARAALPSPRTA